jgi:hypothetical protein
VEGAKYISVLILKETMLAHGVSEKYIGRDCKVFMKKCGKTFFTNNAIYEWSHSWKTILNSAPSSGGAACSFQPVICTISLCDEVRISRCNK